MQTIQPPLKQAIGTLEKEVAARPDHFEAFFELTALYYQAGQHHKAIESCRKAIRLRPDCAVCHNNLGVLYREQEVLDKAEKHFLRAIDIVPADFDANFNLATLLERCNRIEESWKHIQEALSVRPASPEASLIAARIDRRRGDCAAALRRLQPLADTPMQENHAMMVRFELGFICDRLGKTEQAFSYFQSGNRLMAQASNRVDKEAYQGLVTALQNRFTSEWVAGWSSYHQPATEAAPIFLIGFPRSGTTLLDRMLSRHPQLHVLEEKPLITDLRKEVEAKVGSYPDALANISQGEITLLQEKYSQITQMHRGPQPPGIRVIDKLPLNMVHAGLIARVFPNARFILALRHPCDVVLSCFMQPFRANTAMANFYSLEESVSLYVKIMRLWHSYTTLLPLNVYPVHYENVVDDAEQTLRGLLEFLELPWHAQIIDHTQNSQNKVKINTPSYHQVASPIYTHAKERWQRYAKQLSPHIHHLMPFITAFGYSCPEEPTASEPSSRV